MTKKEVELELKSVNTMLEDARRALEEQEQEIVDLKQQLLELEKENERLRELYLNQKTQKQIAPSKCDKEWADEAIDSLLGLGINKDALMTVVEQLSPRWNETYHRVVGPEKIIKALHARLGVLETKSYLSVNQNQWEVKWRK